MNGDLERVLIPRDRIAARVREMAGEIERVYSGDNGGETLTLVTILSGSLIFLADLIRELPLRMKIGLITVSSYRGTTRALGPRIVQDLTVDVAGRHVLLIDDILDTGGTLRMVRQQIWRSQPKSMRICVLLRKPSKAPPDLVADFVGFDIEDRFVVGYGLDYNDLYRNLPDIGVLRKELYTT